MRLGGVQWTTLVDYPGHLAATVFTAGCNFRCPFCHNPELVLPERIAESSSLDAEEVLEELGHRAGFLEGVVVSGGEPTLHPELPKFLQRIKTLGLSVKLDTNGSRPDVVETVLMRGWVDHVAMDIKAPLERYSTMAGVPIDPEKIQRSIRLVRTLASSYEFRTTAAPGLSERDICTLGEDLSGASAYWLQVFRAPPEKALVDERCRTQPVLSEDSLREIWRGLRGRFSGGGVRG
jgi:pyruvate formate lyase activating enzyme